MDEELDLAVTSYGKVKPLNYDLVLLPWGATEPHNLHLPYLRHTSKLSGMTVQNVT